MKLGGTEDTEAAERALGARGESGSGRQVEANGVRAGKEGARSAGTWCKNRGGMGRRKAA